MSSQDNEDLTVVSRKEMLYVKKSITKKKKDDRAALLVQVAACPHDWKHFVPSGPRDNGERYLKCTICGKICDA